MVNSPGPAQPSTNATPAQCHVRLRRGVIRTDGLRLQRTAEFTNGSTCTVHIQWSEVRRVAAFRRDVLTQPVICVAISDPANLVVVDECMEGWQSLLDALAQSVAPAPSFTEWRSNIRSDDADSHWTALFQAQGPAK